MGMTINDLPKSEITQAAPSIAPKPVEPPKPEPKAPEPKPAAAKPEVKPEVKPEEKKPEITDVKATGEKTEEGEPVFTLKVNGKEYKATQSEIISLAQRAKGADAAMKAKAEIEKAAADLLTTFDNDAYGLLVKRHGPEKAKEIAISMVKNLIAQEARDPKDIEIDRLKAENEMHKQAQERLKKEQEAAERAIKQKQLYGKMLMEIDAELNNTHLPKDKLTLTRVLQFLGAGKKANGQAWTVKDAVQAVEQEDMGHASYYAKRYVEGKLPSEQFRKIFGEETFKKLTKEQIELLKNADKSAKVKVAEEKAASTEPVKKPRTLSRNRGTEAMSEREYRRQHGSIGGL